ncbi:MAG: hypothetical protein PF505_04725, partial [Vallitaleaceae bacterium]|nr:hypothetical protein [Vallitaleaceae bacterium]
MGGYKRLLEQSFLPFVKERRTINGAYAVIYDKYEMEASGYASTLAQLTIEIVYLVTFFEDEPSPSVRYVTQKPWNRIPIKLKTLIYNPIIACLAGGRNKRMASKAYDFFNGELKNNGLKIHTPET